MPKLDVVDDGSIKTYKQLIRTGHTFGVPINHLMTYALGVRNVLFVGKLRAGDEKVLFNVAQFLVEQLKK